MNLDAAIKALEEKGIRTVTRGAAVKQRSRDYFWYSPVLKDRLDHVVADFFASRKARTTSSRSCASAMQTMSPSPRVARARAITGKRCLWPGLRDACGQDEQGEGNHPGRVICEPGVILKDLDAACIADSGQEIRMFSSTWSTATIGGFIAGGSGVGSIRWGCCAIRATSSACA